MTRLSAHSLTVAQRPTAGGALRRMFYALYGRQAHRTTVQRGHVVKAPARGAVGRSRGGVQARLDSARGRDVEVYAP